MVCTRSSYVRLTVSICLLLCVANAEAFSSSRTSTQHHGYLHGSTEKHHQDEQRKSSSARSMMTVEGGADESIASSQRELDVVPPSLDGFGKLTPPSKADLYSSDELENLLSLHTSLSSFQFSTAAKKDEEQQQNSATALDDITGIPSFHNLVLDAIRDIEQQGGDSKKQSALPDEKKDNNFGDDDDDDLFEVSMRYTVTDEMRSILPKIRAIASDVDGTLVDKSGQLHPSTKRAIERAVAVVEQRSRRPNSTSHNNNVQFFFPATGKTRAGALHSLGPELKALLSNLPGVFIQGNYCVDGKGNVVWEQKLPTSAIQASEALVAQFPGLSVIAYDGDNLYSTDTSLPEYLDTVHDKYGEPTPVVIETTPTSSLYTHENGFHKVLFCMDDTETLVRDVRPQLEALAKQHNCVVTQAVPTMLELLPPNSGKEVGVKELCKALGIQDPGTELMFVGDAENDIKTLELAAFGVAVGNASPLVKQAARFVLQEGVLDGGAGYAIELFGLGKILETPVKNQ